MARIFLAIYYIHLYSHKLQLQELEIKKNKEEHARFTFYRDKQYKIQMPV